MSTDAILLAIHIADCLIQHISKLETKPLGNTPKETHPEHLLWMLGHLRDKAEKEEWSETKVHRWLGYVMGCLAAQGICDLTCLKQVVANSKLYFDEKEDEDLRAHNDPDDYFTFDIGGEG